VRPRKHRYRRWNFVPIVHTTRDISTLGLAVTKHSISGGHIGFQNEGSKSIKGLVCSPRSSEQCHQTALLNVERFRRYSALSGLGVIYRPPPVADIRVNNRPLVRLGPTNRHVLETCRDNVRRTSPEVDDLLLSRTLQTRSATRFSERAKNVRRNRQKHVTSKCRHDRPE
jgi:hypothetical protein